MYYALCANVEYTCIVCITKAKDNISTICVKKKILILMQEQIHEQAFIFLVWNGCSVHTYTFTRIIFSHTHTRSQQQTEDTHKISFIRIV